MVHRWTDGAGRREILSAGHGEEREEWRSVESRPVKFMMENLEEMGELLRGGYICTYFLPTSTLQLSHFALHPFIFNGIRITAGIYGVWVILKTKCMECKSLRSGVIWRHRYILPNSHKKWGKRLFMNWLRCISWL